MDNLFSLTGLIFLLVVLLTFAVTFVARKHSTLSEGGVADENLNKWLVGLSAGATANSGFIVTAGVGLGYVYGVQWILLPLAWLLGDIVFWLFFPHKINEYGRKAKAHTLTELVTHNLNPSWVKAVSLIVGLIVILCLGGYTAAQWLAGQKFLNGAFGISPLPSLFLIGSLIVGYTAIGGFRGSIYADSFQAIVRLIGTVICIWGVWHVAKIDLPSFNANIADAGPTFLKLFSFPSFGAGLGFILGFAFAGFGFGLGQPQIISRYLAGASPKETRSAWWIYLGFVQFTWIAMTLFGVLLRGVMPELDDPETGLSIFFTVSFGPIVAGLIVSDVFATISATTNSLLVSMSQSLKHDLLKPLSKKYENIPLWLGTVLLGGLSMGVAYYAQSLGGSVFDLALSSASLMGAGLAPLIIIKTLNWRHHAFSLLVAIVMGMLVAWLWRSQGYSSIMNEAGPGMIVGLLTNYIIVRTTKLSQETTNV